MRTHWKEIASLLFLSPALIELLSGNTSASNFFSPFVLFIFMTVAYGFVVLIIRELMVRYELGLPSVFLLGFAYGLFNEGLLARTLFEPFAAPIPTFAHYGLLDDVRLPWVLTIGAVHALYSVVCPIFVVHFLFPKSAHRPWLGKYVPWVLASLSLLAGVVTFLSGTTTALAPGQASIPGRMDHLLFILAAWVCIGILAAWLPNHPRITESPPMRATWRSPLFGVALYLVFFVVPLVFASNEVSPVIFFSYFAVLITALGYTAMKWKPVPLQNAMAIVLGAEIALGIFSLFLAVVGRSVERIITALVFLAVFYAWSRSVRRATTGTQSVAT